MPIRRRTPRRDRLRGRLVEGCPLTRNRSPWCFRLCRPQDGRGACGRVAPHALVGRTEAAILRHRTRRAAE